MGISFKGESSIALITKKGNKNVTNHNYIALTEPLIKELDTENNSYVFLNNMGNLL